MRTPLDNGTDLIYQTSLDINYLVQVIDYIKNSAKKSVDYMNKNLKQQFWKIYIKKINLSLL